MANRFSGKIFAPIRHGDANPVVTSTEWEIAQELPLVIFYNGVQFGVMMLTPDDFEDFAIGFSLSEGIVNSPNQIKDIRLEPLAQGMGINVIVPETALEIAKERKRTITGGSSCGICGAQTLAIALPAPKKTNGFIPLPQMALQALKNLPHKQKLRQQNYSTHAAALADSEGKIMLLREDVGRHNSLDKLIGAMAKDGLSPQSGFLVLSSRYSIEMAQKAASAGFSFVACVSAPTSLALQVSQRAAIKVGAQAGTDIIIFD